jgi:hypothetical protein
MNNCLTWGGGYIFPPENKIISPNFIEKDIDLKDVKKYNNLQFSMGNI